MAEKTKIYKEETKIYSNAPVQSVKIDNISLNKTKKNKNPTIKMYINIADFYSKKSASLLKQKIKQRIDWI